MAQELLINVTAHEIRVALLEKGVLAEIHIERSRQHSLLGNIYKGKVTRLLPGIQAAFVDIGLDRSAFLHVSDMLTDASAPLPEIHKLARVGQELLVQVYKDHLGNKGARLTTQFTIPSRYLVLTPQNRQTSVSQRITDAAMRERLLAMVAASAQGGFIVRTAAVEVTQAEVDADREFLSALWQDIAKRAAQAAPLTLVYQEIPMLLRVLRDLVSDAVTRIYIDDAAAVATVRAFAERFVPHLAARIEFYGNGKPLFDSFGVEEELQRALQRHINLKSGGHLVFDQTEAMTTIDVNTGSYVGHINLEQTIFLTNLEAVAVLTRQIRLRNLGGIIIIDFIDMASLEHQCQLWQALADALAQDSVRTHISELSNLGLVQLTRKRTRESLEHILCVPCPLCQKRGSIKSIATVCYEIFRKLQRAAQLFAWPGFEVVVAREVAVELLAEQSMMLPDLRAQLQKVIRLRVDISYAQEQYDILPLADSTEG